jgi:hypothetical protein
MVGADEDENRIWDIGRKIKIKMKEAAGYR